MPDPAIIYRLSTNGGHKPVGLDDATRRFRKDVARFGTFFARDPETGNRVPLAIDAVRADKWINTFKLYRQNGNKVNLTIDHEEQPSNSAESKYGEVVDLFRARYDGDDVIPDPAGTVLGFDTDLADDEAVKLAQRCPEVSLELEKDVSDGSGNHYDEAMTAITICQHPVIGGQRAFRRIAASRGGADGTANAIMLHFAADPPTAKPDHKPDDPQEPPTMDLKLTTAALAGLVSLGLIQQDAKPEDVIKGLEGLEGKKLADPNVEQTLADLTKERDTLKGQVTELEKGKTPEVDEDVLEETAENRQDELNALVTAGKITPAVSEKLAASLIGKSGSRPKICLSRKAAKHAGIADPLAKLILDALKDNDPVALNKQHSEAQSSKIVASTQPVHGGSDDDLDALEKRVKDRAGSKA